MRGNTVFSRFKRIHWARYSYSQTKKIPDISIEINHLFYHDVGEIFWPQPIRLLKLGHVTGQGSMSPTWVGRVSDPGKNGFHKKYKNVDNIAVYLIASLKSKWKNKQIKNMNNWVWKLSFIYVLEGNLQWNSWIFKMTGYLKGSIVKFKLNFEKALENKCESVWWWQISSKTLVCLGWGNLSIVNQTLLWHHSGCYTCYQGETIRSHDPKMCTCNHACCNQGQFWDKFEH